MTMTSYRAPTMARYTANHTEADGNRGVLTLEDVNSRRVLSTSEYAIRMGGDPKLVTLTITCATWKRETATGPFVPTDHRDAESIAVNIVGYIKENCPISDKIERLMLINTRVAWTQDKVPDIIKRVQAILPGITDFKFHGE